MKMVKKDDEEEGRGRRKQKGRRELFNCLNARV